jgi:hypothetical protein
MAGAAAADDGGMESAVHALTEDVATRLSGPEFGQGLRAALRRVEEPRGEPAAGVEAYTAAIALVKLHAVQVDTNIVPPRRHGPHVAIAAAAFVAVEAGRMAVFAAVTIGSVAGLVTLATVFVGP